MDADDIDEKVVSSIRKFEGMGVWKVVFWVSFEFQMMTLEYCAKRINLWIILGTTLKI